MLRSACRLDSHLHWANPINFAWWYVKIRPLWAEICPFPFGTWAPGPGGGEVAPACMPAALVQPTLGTRGRGWGGWVEGTISYLLHLGTCWVLARWGGCGLTCLTLGADRGGDALGWREGDDWWGRRAQICLPPRQPPSLGQPHKLRLVVRQNPPTVG